MLATVASDGPEPPDELGSVQPQMPATAISSTNAEMWLGIAIPPKLGPRRRTQSVVHDDRSQPPRLGLTVESGKIAP